MRDRPRRSRRWSAAMRDSRGESAGLAAVVCPNDRGAMPSAATVAVFKNIIRMCMREQHTLSLLLRLAGMAAGNPLRRSIQ